MPYVGQPHPQSREQKPSRHPPPPRLLRWWVRPRRGRKRAPITPTTTPTHRRKPRPTAAAVVHRACQGLQRVEEL